MAAWNTVHAIGDTLDTVFSAALFEMYKDAAEERMKSVGDGAGGDGPVVGIGSERPCRIASSAAAAHIDGSALVNGEIAINDADGLKWQYSSGGGGSWALAGNGINATVTTYTEKAGVKNDFIKGDYRRRIVDLWAYCYGAWSPGYATFIDHSTYLTDITGVADPSTISINTLTKALAAAMLTDGTTLAGYTGDYPIRKYPRYATNPYVEPDASTVAPTVNDIAIGSDGLKKQWNGTAWVTYGNGINATPTQGAFKYYPQLRDFVTADLFNQLRDMINTCDRNVWYFVQINQRGGTGDHNQKDGTNYGSATYGAALTAAATDYTHLTDNTSNPEKYSEVTRVNAGSWNAFYHSLVQIYQMQVCPTFTGSRMDGYIQAVPHSFGNTNTFDDNGDPVLNGLYSLFSTGTIDTASTRNTDQIGTLTIADDPSGASITALSDSESTVAGWKQNDVIFLLDWRLSASPGSGFAYTFDT